MEMLTARWMFGYNDSWVWFCPLSLFCLAHTSTLHTSIASPEILSL